MRKLPLVAGAALSVLALSAGAQNAPSRPYIVELVDAPTASYAGGTPGYRATRPAAGSRLNVNAADVQAYVAYLDSKQRAVAAAVPGAIVGYRYKHLVNGFSAFLTDAEVAKLAATPGVRSIQVDELVPVDTSYTPTFLGINQPGGAWSRTDANGRSIKGEGIIIGHLDGGVWPENPSFSDKVDSNGKPIASHLTGTVVYDPLPAGRWNGTCQPSSGPSGQSFTAADCNNKLIGARFFNTTWKLAESLGIVTTWSGEYLDSPRDADGHGTHTLSTSGGNENVTANVAGSNFVVSGIAPRARVAAYKVCYVGQDASGVPQQGSCFQSDSAAAADQAVADGVDVINFSVGGSRTSFTGVVDTAFANATLAGVFVAASAGNSNVFPGNATTVAHINPWVMTVGNSTHDRFTVATVTLGSGQTATGPSFQTSGVTTKPLVLATDAGVTAYALLSDADKLALARCYNAADRAANGASAAAALDPAKVAGKIVVCYRGGNVLVNKTSEVAARGGAGVVLQNLPTNLLPAPLNGGSANTVFNIAHAIPTVHLLAADASNVINHAAGAGATASFTAGVQIPGITAPVMSDSSSRGPNQADPNLLKPDITAPGTDIIAAYTNTSITPAQRLDIISGALANPGPGANMISGTSMASPHVAGAAALLKQANPGWSPMAIKSTLMTSAVQNVKLANGASDPNVWGYGAGHLNPNAALDTKVVYDWTGSDLVAYYSRAINGRTLNYPSLQHANVVGVGTLTRTLTNKGTTPATYNASAAIAGYDVTVSPATLTIPPGGSESFTVTMRRTTAPIEQWVFGNLTWTSAGQPTLRSPLNAKASEIVVPPLVTDTRTTGSKIWTAGFGYDGALVTTGFGMQPARVERSRIATNDRQCFAVAVATGTKILRAQLFNVDTEGGATSDLDLEVLRGTTLVGSSGGADSNELVSLVNPTAASNYTVCVVGYAPANGSASYALSIWTLGPANPGTLRAFGPTSVRTGGVGSIGASWNLPVSQRYLGVVEHRTSVSGPIIGSTQLFLDGAAAGLPLTATMPVASEKPLSSMR